MTGRDRALVTTNNLDSPLGSSDGLPADYVERLFEYERSQWRRQGFISPYNNDRPRAARDKLEFLLWLHWHPDRRVLQKKLDERYDEEYDRSYVPISDGAQLRGGPPRGNRHDDRRHDQEQYRQRRGAIIYKRPTYRVRGLLDHRDPRYRPPYPAYGINEFQRDTNRPPRGTHKVPRNRHPKRYPVPRKIQGSRGTVRPRHHAYGILRSRASQSLFGQPSRDYSVSGRRTRYPQIYDGYESRGVERPSFTPRIPLHLPHRPHNEEDDYEEEEEEEEEIYDDDDDDDDDEDNIRSQQSNDSFVRSRISAHRLSPHFIYPNPAPYYGRPLGHSMVATKTTPTLKTTRTNNSARGADSWTVEDGPTALAVTEHISYVDTEAMRTKG